MQQRAISVSAPRAEPSTSPVLVLGLFAIVLAALVFAAWTYVLDHREGAPDPLVGATTHTRGSSDAPVTVVVFSDFQCEDCAAFARDVQPALESDFIEPGIVRLAYRQYPLVGGESIRAAEASECAALQGKFWEYHTVLYGWQGAANVGNFSDELLEQLAIGVRLHPGEYRSCMRFSKTIIAVEDDLRQGFSAGVREVPAVFVNGLRVDAPTDYVRLRSLILRAATGG